MQSNITYKKIQDIFGWRKQYCEFLLQIIRALCASETTSLTRLSLYLGYENQQAAVQRLRRFLSGIVFPQGLLAQFIAELCSLFDHEKWMLILDRTAWEFGKMKMTFLYLSVGVGKYSIPLFFSLLGPNKKGNSSFQERHDLLSAFLETFGKGRIKYILGDREFIGFPWLNFLKTNDIPFSQRIRESGQKIADAHGEMVMAKYLFSDLKPLETRDLGMRKIGESQKNPLYLRVCGTRSRQGDLVVVVSQNLCDPLEAYARRWSIEICFRTLKSKGFGIEDSHVTDPKRIVCLLSLVSLTFAFTIELGNLIESGETVFRKVKNHGYLEKSIVRFVLDLIKPMLLHCISQGLFSKKHCEFLFPENLLKLVG